MERPCKRPPGCCVSDVSAPFRHVVSVEFVGAPARAVSGVTLPTVETYPTLNDRLRSSRGGCYSRGTSYISSRSSSCFVLVARPSSETGSCSTKEETAMSIRKVMAILALAVVVSFGGIILTRHMIAVAGEMDAERLNRSILDYIAQKNPQAPIGAFRRFPEVLLAEAQ